MIGLLRRLTRRDARAPRERRPERTRPESPDPMRRRRDPVRPDHPKGPAMIETKSLFASRTFWGAAVTLAASLAGLLGHAVGPDEQARALDLAGEIAAVWDRLAANAGAAVAIWGRGGATAKIG
jgi:hypothetical protein